MSKQLYDYAMNDRVELYLLIKTAEEKTTRNGKLFISFTFQDRSGEMIGNHWDATTEDVEKFQEGQVVYLEGKRDEYKGTPQLRIHTLRLADDSEPNNPELYVKRAPLKKEEMID